MMKELLATANGMNNKINFTVIDTHYRNNENVLCDYCGNYTHKQAIFIDRRRFGAMLCARCTIEVLQAH